MEFTTEKIDKIVSFKTIKDREKISRLLEIDAIQYTNLGIDSSKRAKSKVKRNSRYIYRAIQELDYEMGTKFLLYQDK